MKIKEKNIAHRVKGKVSKNRLTGSKDSGLSTSFLTLDGALIAKAQNKKKTANSFKQQLLKNRYAQLECMYKAMTLAQSKAFEEYCLLYNVKHQTNLTTAQIFKKLGMNYELSDFLTEKCGAKYLLEIKEETDTHAIVILNTVNFKTSPEPATPGI